MSDSRRGKLIVTVVVVAALGTLGWWRLGAARDRQQEARRAATMRDLGAARAEVQRWLEGREEEARLAADLVQPLLGRSPVDRATESLRRHAGWTAVLVFDRAGGEVAATPGAHPRARELDAVRRVLAGAPPARLPLDADSAGALSIAWVEPVVGGGAVLARAEPALALLPAPSDLPGAHAELVAVVGGRYVVLSPAAAAGARAHPLPRALAPGFAAAALAGRDTFGIFRDVRGREVQAGAMTVPATGWAVVSQTDLGAGYAAVMDDMMHELTVVSAVLLPVLLVALLALRGSRVAREREMRRSEASYRSFVEHSPFGIYRSTAEGRFSAVNGALVQILGYESREALLAVADMGREIYVEPGERDRLVSERMSESGGAPRVVRWRRRDGRVITVRLSCRPLRDEQGRLTGWEGFLEDVTPLHEAEDALRRAEALAAMGQLVSGVAHELSNPLTAILHFADELERNADRGVDAEALTVVREQAQRCREIVRDLLAMARRREATREVVELGPLVERAVLALRPRLIEAGVRVDVAVPGAPACVMADRAGLEQVVTNLVSNAADATGSGGHVTVEVVRSGGEWLLQVDDDGPGIPDHVRARLFEPFFTTKGDGKGTGLGLPVSLGIVEQHGGRLTAENRPEGGARFAVALAATSLRPSPPSGLATPRRSSRAVPAPADEGTPVALPPGAGLRSDAPRALLVDDQAAVRAALRRLCEVRGWAADEAGGVEEAERHWRARQAEGQPYALVLADLHLPDGTGASLLGRIAELQPDVASRFVLCTGDPSAQDSHLAEQLGCRLMEKPFDFTTLVRLLDTLAPTIVRA